MSIQTVIVPVPVSGQGAIASVSALTGAKTIVLTGRFRGYYDLLGSQDDVNFIGVTSFNAGGVESIKQTVPGSFKSFRLFSSAVPDGVVGCEVSGVVGQNFFTTLASLPVGFTGLGPVIDTYALFPPTGVEQDTCFLCAGGFRGSVVVLGSLDGVQFNAIGAFTVDRVPEGSPARLTFPAIVSQDKVRYLQVKVAGQVTSPVTVTMGGSTPSVAPPVATSNVSIITSLFPLPGNFLLQGIQTATSPVTDSRGNTVVPGLFTGDDAVCLGEYNTVNFSINPTSGPDIVVGVGNTLRGNSLVVAGAGNSMGSESRFVAMHGLNNTLGDNPSYTEIVGSENNLSNNIAHAVVVGTQNSVDFAATAAAKTYLVIVGSANTIDTACNFCQAIGRFVTIRHDSADVFAAGDFVTVQVSTQVVAVGNFVSVEPVCSKMVALGSNLTIEHDTTTCVVLGAFNVVTTACSRTVAIGTDITVLADDPYSICVGAALQIGVGSAHATIVGTSSTIGTNSPATVAMGQFTIIQDNCTTSTVVGSNNTLGSGSFRASIFGNNSQMRGDNLNCILVGPLNQIGAHSDNCTLIGQNAHVGTVGSGGDTDDAIVVGNGAYVGDSLDNVIAIGHGAAGLASNSCVVGDSTTGPIHTFTIKGFNVAGLNTLAANDAPASGDIGLQVCHNDGVSVTNKTVKASASPPVGAVLLYVDP